MSYSGVHSVGPCALSGCFHAAVDQFVSVAMASSASWRSFCQLSGQSRWHYVSGYGATITQEPGVSTDIALLLPDAGSTPAQSGKPADPAHNNAAMTSVGLLAGMALCYPPLSLIVDRVCFLWQEASYSQIDLCISVDCRFFASIILCFYRLFALFAWFEISAVVASMSADP